MRTGQHRPTTWGAHQGRCARFDLNGQRRDADAERGIVLMTVLMMATVLTLLGALVMFTAGREIALSGTRSQGAQSLYIAEGGAVAARSALMAYLGLYPSGNSQVLNSLTFSTASAWYANGVNGSQDPFAILNYLQIDGQSLSFTTPTSSVALQVNWGLSTAHLKFQTTDTPANALGAGSYTATVTLTPNPTDDPQNNSCAGGPCAIHMLGPNYYEIFYNYTVTSIGSVSPQFRREVTLSGTFSVQLHLQNFAVYALFTDTHSSPGGQAVWFTNTTTFNGPVHTNDEFRFLQFPTFTGTLESVNTKAWFYNNGHNIERAANSNVSNSGVRIDAPLVPPDPTPQAATPAAFTRGVPVIPLPTDPYNQQGVSIGLNPGNTGQVSNAQIAAAVPELNGGSSVPNGIYVPVQDTCTSMPGDNLGGGIYVQGSLDSLAMSVSGSTAVYTFTQGSTTTTVTVDRTNNQTTVWSNNWLPPSTSGGCVGGSQPPDTRTFNGVPKGWQGPGNDNGTMIYVEGSINSLTGTLQQNEQTTITASHDIVIQDNILYQNPPNPSDPTSNPTNLLGLFTSGGDIVIGSSAPNNVTIDAVLLAGTSTSSSHNSVNVSGYNSGSPRGTATVLGGVVEKYYGAFGTVNGSGVQQTGYGRNFTFDTRMSRGFSPPYFPTTGQFVVNQGSVLMTGVKPAWREATPP